MDDGLHHGQENKNMKEWRRKREEDTEVNIYNSVRVIFVSLLKEKKMYYRRHKCSTDRGNNIAKEW